MTPVLGASTVGESCGAFTSRYEALRGAALGIPVEPRERVGLTVLLHRGLWAWFRAVSSEPSPVRRQVCASQRGAGRSDDRDLVHLFADITLACTGRTR